MMTIELNWIIYLLLASNTVLVGAAALAILRAERLSARQKSFWDSPTGAALGLQADHQQLLDAFDRRLRVMADQVGNPAAASQGQEPESPKLPYENAVRMARHGASIDDLTRTCGLSSSEARLLMRVHGGSTQLAEAG